MLDWLRTFRRRRILTDSFPEEWKSFLSKGFVHDRFLDEAQRRKHRRLVQVFVSEKNWEGCNGLAVTEEIKVTIAAQACLLVVGMPDDEFFDQVMSILVYPRSYIAKDVEVMRSGAVLEGKQARLGETIWRGPVVLSWPDARAGGRMQTPGHNLVFHEFAHQLDMLNGRVPDGTPLLASRELTARWDEVMEAEYENLSDACRRRRPHVLDCYGATDRCEFFAVATEAFFERGRELQTLHPELYEMLSGFYRLDTAKWD